MKIKMLAGLLGLFMLVVISGCGGGNNGTPVTSASGYNSGSNDFASNNVPPFLAKPSSSSTLLTLSQDDFEDGIFTDKWNGPLVSGNYTVVESGGKLNISGSGVPDPDPQGYHGGAALINKAQTCAESPFEIGVDVDLSGTLNVPPGAYSSAFSQAVFVISDGGGKTVTVGIGASTDCGSGLFFANEGTPVGPGCPPLIASGAPLQGRLTVAYNNGTYEINYGALHFVFPPAAYRTLSGPVSLFLFAGTRVDIIHPNFPTVLAPQPTTNLPTVSANFDNFIFKGGLDCIKDQIKGQLQEKCNILRSIASQLRSMQSPQFPIGNSLAAKLEAICRSIERGSDALDKGQLNVAFNMFGTAINQSEALINEIDAQTDKRIPAPGASGFISFLQTVIINQLQGIRDILS